jgi:Methyltransferase domain
MCSQFQPETVKALIEQSLKGHSRSFHLTRLFMYKHLSGKLQDHDGPDKCCLTISYSKSLGQLLGLTRCKYEEANYPEYRVDDLKLGSGRFNFCVSDQVFQHVEGNPFTAFAETVRVLKPGGLYATQPASSILSMASQKISGGSRLTRLRS